MSYNIGGHQMITPRKFRYAPILAVFGARNWSIMSMFGYRKETEIDVNINFNILYHKGAQKDRYYIKKTRFF